MVTRYVKSVKAFGGADEGEGESVSRRKSCGAPRGFGILTTRRERLGEDPLERFDRQYSFQSPQ